MYHRRSNVVLSRQHGRRIGTALTVAFTDIQAAFLARPEKSRRNWRRYKIFWGLAAIGAFLFALPAAAMACVNSCPGGTAAVNGAGFPFCQGGTNNGILLCTSGGPAGLALTRLIFLNPFSFLPDYGFDDLEDVPRWEGGTGRGLGGPPVSVSLYGSDGTSGVYGAAGIAGVHNSGYQVSDSAGTTSGQLPGFHSVSAGGGINAAADGTALIGYNGNQRLLFNFNFGYARDNTQYGTSDLTPGIANAGSVRSDMYTFTGSAIYTRDTYYATGNASFDWSHSGVTNNLDGGTGDTDGHGYSVGATAGKWFQLYGAPRRSSAIPTKAAPLAGGDNALYLNLEGNIAYQNQRDNGFTDTTGFVSGTEQLSFTDLGVKAKLVDIIPSSGFAWMPFVGVSIDRELGFSHTADIPTQAATTADTLFIGQSNTFWGVQTGLNILSRGGITAGITGFYTASTDTNIVGGTAFLKIPFYPDPPHNDGGIREAKK